MRKNNFYLLSSIVLLISFSACNNGSSSTTERDVNLIQDSASFQNNTASDTADLREEGVTEIQPRHEHGLPATPATTKSRKSASPVAPGAVSATSDEKTTPVTSQETATQSATEQPEIVTKEEPVVNEKKGISKTAQGAIIGGAAGAVGGAIISKNKGVGAVVGGVAGAAAGAIIGKQKEKKDQQKKDEQTQEQKQ